MEHNRNSRLRWRLSYGIDEAAAASGLSRASFYRWRHRGAAHDPCGDAAPDSREGALQAARHEWAGMSEPRTKSFIGGRFGSGVTFRFPTVASRFPAKAAGTITRLIVRTGGNPSDWNPTQINAVQHRELGSEVEAFQRDLALLSKSELRWFDAVSLAVYRRDPLTRFAWLSPPRLDHESDSTLFVGVPGTTVNLQVRA